MAKKKSFYVGPELQSALAARAGVDGESRVLNRICDRYAEVVRRSTPRLKRGEWLLLFDALNGSLCEPAELVAVLPAGVEDFIRLEAADKKWGVDGERLISKLEVLTYPQLVAVADAAERFWALPEDAGDAALIGVVGEKNVEEE